MRPTRYILSVCLFVVSACSTDGNKTNSNDAKADHLGAGSVLRAGNRYAGATGDRYLDEIQPILASRCAVCHSCTNGPCQLNLTSFAALERGVDRYDPYDFGVFDKEPTRVSDNLSTGVWRDQGFSSILGDEDSQLSPKQSMLLRAIEHGRNNRPIEDPRGTNLNMETVRHLANMKEQTCSLSPSEYDEFEQEHANGGMPWALPTVTDDEYETLREWILDGAPGPAADAMARVQGAESSAATQISSPPLVSSWERFLNADDFRSQLVGRYLYEHTFFANLSFKENPGEFYRMVRSATGPGQPISRIVTKLPTDDPGVNRVYYRLQKIDRVIETKTHVGWEVDQDEAEHTRSLFLDRQWDLGELPGYDEPNPFVYFAAIPAEARSLFMWRNSRMILQSFARGTICMVQTATYAVDEYYWLWFLRPESDPTVQDPTLGLKDLTPFYGRDQDIGTSLMLGSKFGEPTYRQAFEDSLRKLKPEGLGIEDIWTGGGEDPDAWLTVHRHQISTEANTARRWPHYARPQSVWLMSYANFERMYYNAAARYRYWGGLKSQFDTFAYQVYTRTEAEDLYASLFSKQETRDDLRQRFTSTAGRIYHNLWEDYAEGRPATTPTYWTELELQRAVFKRMGTTVTGTPDDLNHMLDHGLPGFIAPQIDTITQWETGLRSLTERELPFAQHLPNLVLVRLGGEHVYTLMANRGYNKDKIHVLEGQARRPDLDTMIAAKGLYGAQPHLFIDLSFDDAADFLRALESVERQSDWSALRERFGIPRNSQRVWTMLDWFHEYQSKHQPAEAGILEMRFYDKEVTAF